jgi:eukaryotic-like serine/threonine-protein kinase
MPLPGASAQARLGRYELLARLATGGMGEIFLARLEGAAGFEKLYVVKRILPHLADDARFRQMLIAEAQIAAKMAHANICHVYELGETAGQLYIVMEYLEGVTMLPLLRRASKADAPLDLGFVAGVVQQATDALHYAHELKDRDGEPLGVIHRDVTPANVFLCETGVAKVLDFGIAKARGASAKTEDGAVKGKYAYMAPEQLRGGAIDRRVDLFALGVVMYEMLALRRLFQRKTDYLTFRAVMEQPIPDIRRYRPDIPEPLADALSRALERDPDKRFETARQLGTAILDAIGGRPWSQGELGDFVKANFIDELSKRSQQVASAISRNADARNQRVTIPIIANEDVGHDPDDDDDAFPPVETDVDAAGPAPVTPPSPSPRTTLPPFMMAGESTGSSPTLQPLRSLSPAPIVVMRRSVVWPLLAVAGVAVAGAALVLVWHQMQQQQPQQPAVINVTQTPDDRAHVVATEPVQGSGSDPHIVVAHPAAVPHKTRSTAYDQALAARKQALTQCLVDHPDGRATDEISATIIIAASGRAQTVQLKPDNINAAPLGGCFRNVLMATPFPAGVNTITVPLKAKNS